MAEVSLKDVSKWFGDVVAVENITLKVEDQELIVLVGPSGCGKTTTLRMIAGLEKVSSGEIRIGDSIVNRLSPAARNVAMVFQNFALYPHMTAYQNMAFPLESRRISREETHQRVTRAASILQIEELLNRKPKEMSGGQQQRVALGRAIVRQPAVLLMDEPLSNLDAKLRVEMRTELKQLQRELGVTTVYVTHDQTEAMTMGDRIVVMQSGVIQQIGMADDIYNRPANVFVAGLIGSPPMNFFNCQLSRSEGRLYLRGDGFAIPLPDAKVQTVKQASLSGQVEVNAGIRPEDLKVEGGALLDLQDYPIEVEVEVIEPLGSDTLFRVAWGDRKLMVRTNPDVAPRAGEHIDLFINTRKVHLFDAHTEDRIA